MDLCEGRNVGGELSKLAGGDCGHAAPKVGEREGVAELLAREALALRLGDKPRVEDAKEQRGGDAAEDAANHENLEEAPVLGRAVAKVD